MHCLTCSVGWTPKCLSAVCNSNMLTVDKPVRILDDNKTSALIGADRLYSQHWKNLPKFNILGGLNYREWFIGYLYSLFCEKKLTNVTLHGLHLLLNMYFVQL